MNRIVLLGRLIRDPEVKIIEEGERTITKFILAVNRSYKNNNGEKSADFIPITLWGKKAEVAAQYLTKGSLISVTGKLETRSYEDRDGKKRFIFDVVGDEIQFVDLKKNEENVAQGL